jgi:hypothetical protein
VSGSFDGLSPPYLESINGIAAPVIFVAVRICPCYDGRGLLRCAPDKGIECGDGRVRNDHVLGGRVPSILIVKRLFRIKRSAPSSRSRRRDKNHLLPTEQIARRRQRVCFGRSSISNSISPSRKVRHRYTDLRFKDIDLRRCPADKGTIGMPWARMILAPTRTPRKSLPRQKR